MNSSKYFAHLLLLLSLMGESLTKLGIHANPGVLGHLSTAARSSPELDTVLSMIKSGEYGRSVLSAVNDYLCKRVKSESTKENLDELVKLGKQLGKVSGTNSRLIALFLDKFRVVVELIVLSKSDDTLCIQDGQNAIQAAALEMIAHEKFMNKPKTKKFSKQCFRIPKLIEHFDRQRQKKCERDGYFVRSLADNIDALDIMTQRQLTGSLSGLMDFLMGNLGGYNTENCKRKLGNEIDTVDNFDQEAGSLLLDGLKLVLNDEKLNTLKQEGSNDEAEFLQNFVQLRNENLLKPCRTFMNQLREPIKQIRLYASLYGSHQQVQFTENRQDDRRFYRAWAMYNTCELLEEKLPRVSVALLRALNFDTESSKLDKSSMVKILKSTE